jgi:spore germination protein YaaH
MAGLAFLISLAAAQLFPATLRADAGRRPLTIGFYVNWDRHSYDSLSAHIQNLDWVAGSWLFMVGEAMELKESLDAKALDLIRSKKPGMPVLAMIQNASGGVWDGVNLSRLLADPAFWRQRIDAIVAFIEVNKLQGAVIDFEAIEDGSHGHMLTFLAELHSAFKARGSKLAVAVPFDNPAWDYRAYAKASDYLMLMGYDEHWPGGAPGPIASLPWFSSRLAARMRELDPARTIAVIGNYGYDWPVEGGAAVALTVEQALSRAGAAQATVELDPTALNPAFSYESEGKKHRVWFLNAVSARHQLEEARQHHLAGYALWRLGSEDPAIWPVLPAATDATPARSGSR